MWLIITNTSMCKASSIEISTARTENYRKHNVTPTERKKKTFEKSLISHRETGACPCMHLCMYVCMCLRVVWRDEVKNSSLFSQFGQRPTHTYMHTYSKYMCVYSYVNVILAVHVSSSMYVCILGVLAKYVCIFLFSQYLCIFPISMYVSIFLCNTYTFTVCMYVCMRRMYLYV